MVVIDYLAKIIEHKINGPKFTYKRKEIQ